MKKFKWIWWVLIIAAIGVAIWYWKYRADESVIQLQVEKPQYGTISNSVTATGTIQPVDTVNVGSQVSGTIKGVYADFNSTVKKGQLLAKIDPSLFQAQVDQINANLQSAKSNLVYQKSNYERQSQLYAVGAISKADFETALYGYNSAKDNVNGISAQLMSAKKTYHLLIFILLLMVRCYRVISVKDKRLLPALTLPPFLVLQKTLPKCRCRLLLMRRILVM